MPDPRDEGVLTQFDQTNGVVQGLDGESDGTARGDTESDIEQRRDDFDGRAGDIVTGGIGSRHM